MGVRAPPAPMPYADKPFVPVVLPPFVTSRAIFSVSALRTPFLVRGCCS